MLEKIKVWFPRIIFLLIFLFCLYTLYNTKIVSVREQEKNIEELENKMEKKEEPKSTVDISDLNYNIVGALYIPSINLKIAVYDSTQEDAIRKGVGILEGTGTLEPKEKQNVILTTHNGDDKRELFMNLNKVKLGDEFFTKDENGNPTKYIVEDIKKVLPTEVLENIKTGKTPRMTLITCTPMGINSHRLLVTGKQVPYENTSKVEDEMDNNLVFSTYEIIIIIILIISLLLFLLTFIKKKNYGDEDDEDWEVNFFDE